MTASMPRISQNSNYSPHKRGKIWRLRSVGFTYEDVALYKRISKGSVSGIAKRYERQHKGRDLPRPSALKKISEHNKRRIIRIIDKAPFIQNRRLIERACLRCSVSTLISHLRKWGILHKRAIRRPKLASEHAEERLRSAQEHREKPID